MWKQDKQIGQNFLPVINQPFKKKERFVNKNEP